MEGNRKMWIWEQWKMWEDDIDSVRKERICEQLKRKAEE